MRKAAALLIFIISQPLQAAESDEWFYLVTKLQKQEQQLSKPHRQFLNEMANMMTSGDDFLPSKQQQQWLLIIKKRLEEGKK